MIRNAKRDEFSNAAMYPEQVFHGLWRVALFQVFDFAIQTRCYCYGRKKCDARHAVNGHDFSYRLSKEQLESRCYATVKAVNASFTLSLVSSHKIL